jgi:hypothetical protein
VLPNTAELARDHGGALPVAARVHAVAWVTVWGFLLALACCAELYAPACLCEQAGSVISIPA